MNAIGFGLRMRAWSGSAAKIVPFDRAGIRGQEVLTLVQLGAVPFATDR